jgi:hypothetical protein
MAVDTSPDFVMAIIYCLAYDHLEGPPIRDTLQRLRGGAEPRRRWRALASSDAWPSA